MQRFFWLLVLVSPLFNACGNSGKSSEEALKKGFDNETLVKIYNYQDKRNSQALLVFFRDTNTLYREAAVLAFASIQDSNYVANLIPLLKDKELKVRRACAFALGQTKAIVAENVLITAAKAEKDATAQALLLEALGKCAGAKALNFLTSLQFEDDSVNIGLARGIYRAAMKNILSDKGTSLMVNFLRKSEKSEIRVLASNYLARFKTHNLPVYQSEIIQWMQRDANEFVRMNCATALAKLLNTQSFEALKATFKKDKDYRVKVAALRVLSAFPYKDAKEIMLESLNNENTHQAHIASEFFAKNPQKEDAYTLFKFTRTFDNRILNINLLKAAQQYDRENKANDLLKSYFFNSKNVYEQGAVLKALVSKASEYSFVKEQLYQNKHKVIQTQALEALISLRESENYTQLKNNYADIDSDFAEVLKFAIRSRDVGLVYLASQALMNPVLGFKNTFKDTFLLQQTLKQLKLPVDVEAYIELKKALAYLQNKKEDENYPKSKQNPIDWAEVKSLQNEQKVKINTSKGAIILQLFVQEAPGSVATFTKLLRAGFFNKKTFHRVVPNFVVQGGCPRGDGFGGLDYSIRSEFAPLHYEEGSVGLASAGKDTESCQWFITHCPTPHLDGRYTIIGKIIDGMKIVHKITIGDEIIGIELIRE